MDNLAWSGPLHLDGPWHLAECAERCGYRLEALPHTHERHDDGSAVVVSWSEHGTFELLEFQGTLGF